MCFDAQSSDPFHNQPFLVLGYETAKYLCHKSAFCFLQSGDKLLDGVHQLKYISMFHRNLQTVAISSTNGIQSTFITVCRRSKNLFVIAPTFWQHGGCKREENTWWKNQTLEISRQFNTGHNDDTVIDPPGNNICAIAVPDGEFYREHLVSL